MNNDLISRSALIKWIDDSVSQYGHIYSTDMLNMWGLFKDYLTNNVPSVEYPFYQEAYQTGYEEGKNERPQGEWITVHYSREELNVPQKASVFDFVKCPFCETIHQGRHNFCSRCGADMRKGESE